MARLGHGIRRDDQGDDRINENSGEEASTNPIQGTGKMESESLLKYMGHAVGAEV
jgi:hypothetical protein